MWADVPDQLDADAFAALEAWVLGPNGPAGALEPALVPFVIPELRHVQVARP